MNVTIADSLFFPYAKSAKLGMGNASVSPTYFEWEPSDPWNARFVTDSDIKHARGQRQVGFLLETFFLHPENYLAAIDKPFDYVLTHNTYFSRHKGSSWLWYPHGGSFVDFKDWGIHEKSKDLSVLLSHKRQLWGHRIFHEVAEKYRGNLDVFGLTGYAAKLDAIAPYRYTVVVEAERTESFFSEKLIDCLALGTIPIYWGCPNISDFFDPRGIVQVNSMEEIGRALANLDREMYEDRLDVVKSNLNHAMKYRLPEDWIFNQYPFLFERQ